MALIRPRKVEGLALEWAPRHIGDKVCLRVTIARSWQNPRALLCDHLLDTRYPQGAASQRPSRARLCAALCSTVLIFFCDTFACCRMAQVGRMLLAMVLLSLCGMSEAIKASIDVMRGAECAGLSTIEMEYRETKEKEIFNIVDPTTSNQCVHLTSHAVFGISTHKKHGRVADAERMLCARTGARGPRRSSVSARARPASAATRTTTSFEAARGRGAAGHSCQRGVRVQRQSAGARIARATRHAKRFDVERG